MSNTLLASTFNFTNVLIAVAILLAIAGLCGLLLALAAKYLHVEEDPRKEVVTSMLPGYNCGACGCAGCSQFAEKLVSGEAKSVSGCKVIKGPKKEEVVNYLTTTPGPDGKTLDTTI